MHAVMLYSNCKAASLLFPITEKENTRYVSLRTHDGDDNHSLCVLDLMIVLFSWTVSSLSSSARSSTGTLELLHLCTLCMHASSRAVQAILTAGASVGAAICLTVTKDYLW